MLLDMACRHIWSSRAAKPEAQQVAAALQVWPVLIFSATMQDGVITDELHIAWFKFHVQAEFFTAGEGVQRIKRGLLLQRDTRHVIKALGFADGAADIMAKDAPFVGLEYGHWVPGAAAFWNFVPAVPICQLHQDCQMLWMPLDHGVVERG